MSDVPSQEPKRQLIYQLNLYQDREQLISDFQKWRFVRTSPNQPVVAVSNGILGIGSTDGTTFDSPPMDEVANCSVECELRIVDDGGDLSRWAGIRVRGFQDNIMFGYLVYLRAEGKVELYRAGEILAGDKKAIVKNTKDEWTKLRIDLFDTTIKVWVNDQPQPHISTTDTRFRDKGLVYLHTFGTHAQIREFVIYQLTL
jgi:hypothetical protein